MVLHPMKGHKLSLLRFENTTKYIKLYYINIIQNRYHHESIESLDEFWLFKLTFDLCILSHTDIPQSRDDKERRSSSHTVFRICLRNLAPDMVRCTWPRCNQGYRHTLQYPDDSYNNCHWGKKTNLCCLNTITPLKCTFSRIVGFYIKVFLSRQNTDV